MSAPVDEAPARYTVAVRALCEFTAKQGDLDLRFTPSPSAQEGMAGHALVASRRGVTHESEVALSTRVGALRVRGRADGYDPARQRVEEVKTHKGPLALIPDNHRHLHWAQLKVYGALLCRHHALDGVELALVYLDVGTQKETVLTERHAAADLDRFLQELCGRFAHWAEQEATHRAARDQALLDLRFPHDSFRAGQRVLAESVYKAAASGRCLLAQAPTGIGKTVGTLFPMLKACPGQRLDKVYFLSAKASGRALAMQALRRLAPAAGCEGDAHQAHQAHQAQPGRPTTQPGWRVLELVARDKACVHPDKACHGESCPLAQGFYDRLPAARAACVSSASGAHDGTPHDHASGGQSQGPMLLDKAALAGIAQQHGICPYYLGQEMARWADIIVGDYNYYFDLNAMLWGLAQSHQWRVGVLVDEAHNLVERGRRMYSAELDQDSLSALKTTAPAAVRKPLARLLRAWQALNRESVHEYEVRGEIPDAWLTALQHAIAAITTFFSEHPAQVDGALQGFYLEALHFTRMAELFDRHTLCDITRRTRAQRTSSLLCLRNVVPAPFLKPRFEAARSATLFSATLQPQAYYRGLLGLPDQTVWVDVPSPFRAEQLQVHVARRISTRWRDRQASMPDVADVLASQYRQRPGNYLAFFSSHDYLQDVAALLAERHPGIPSWKQARQMSEQDQQAFLARFVPDGQGIGFAVLGGSFSEGVDLPGSRLIGAFIATLGLPQVNAVNEEIRARLDALMGKGYDHAYLYPGIQKVVQAAGRVIRTVDDEGVVHLMDDRYARRDILALMPSWWRLG